MDNNLRKNKFLNTLKSILIAIFFALIIRYVFFQPFKIPSKSMLPNLLVGDHLLANRISFGFSIPCSKEKLVNGFSEISRGDVIIFRWPGDEGVKDCPNGGFIGLTSIYYIKRVIGIPGDVVLIQDQDVFINDKNISKNTKRIYKDGDKIYKIKTNSFGDKSIDVIYNNDLSYVSDEESFEIIVPSGMYFVLGDNRDNSLDSRFWGFVPSENIIGTASIIHFSFNTEFNSFGDMIRFKRMLKVIN